jgi:RNA polymerase sigma factor (sigma-70 family)
MLLAGETNPETEYIRELFWQELFAALEELPENQRQVFIWNELEDMTLQQIADRTGEKLKTIISRKGYAVKHLRQRLKLLYKDFLTY